MRRYIIILHVITGLFCCGSSLLGYGFSGIGEGSTNDVTIFIWLFVWGLGLVAQFMLKNKWIGLFITFIPVGYFLYIYLAAVMM